MPANIAYWYARLLVLVLLTVLCVLYWCGQPSGTVWPITSRTFFFFNERHWRASRRFGIGALFCLIGVLGAYLLKPGAR